MEAIRREVDRRFGSGKIELSPLPEVAQRVLEKAADPLASAWDLSVLIHQDQNLAREILHNANSAGQAGRIAIVSLQQSTARLGVQRVIEIAITASVRDSVFFARGFEEELRELWRRSIATALFSKEVARVLHRGEDEAFLAGLFCRVGTALLIRTMAKLRKPGDPKLSIEEFADLDRSFRVRLGLSAAEQWGLASEVQEVIAGIGCEPSADPCEAVPIGSRIVSMGERLTELLDKEDEAKEEALYEDPIVTELGISPEQLDALIAMREPILRSVDRRD